MQLRSCSPCGLSKSGLCEIFRSDVGCQDESGGSLAVGEVLSDLLGLESGVYKDDIVSQTFDISRDI